MKITSVKTFALEHPLKRGTGPSTYYYHARNTLLVKLETDDGAVGWGETANFGGVRALIEQVYAPALTGRNPLEHRKLWRELWGPNFGNGLALGAVDMALDDLRGKALGVPVADLYGGRLRDRVMAYASAMNYIEGEDPVEQYPREAKTMVARGFGALKMRIGGLPMRHDLAAVSAVRDAVGPDIKLMADGNGAYSLATAIRMGRELERLGLYWFEEPLPQSTPDYSGYETLAATLDIAIAAGEGLTSRGMFKDFIARRAADIVQPDVSLAGGIGECLFVAEMAKLYGVLAMPHCWAGGIVIAATVQLLSLVPDASWARTTEPPMLELDMVENPFQDDILVEPLQISNGFVTVPTTPGLGVSIDEAKLKRYMRQVS